MNAAGEEYGNDDITRGRSLAWLQDRVDKDVWGAWGVEWRDVVVLDDENVVVGILNLSTWDLAHEESRERLRDLFAKAGEGG